MAGWEGGGSERKTCVMILPIKMKICMLAFFSNSDLNVYL